MRIAIFGKNLEISDYLRDMVEKKVAKLERYFPQDTEAQVTLSVERNRHIAEVTIPYEGGIIRAEEITGDMYASVDNVLDKLEKQILRHRTRLEKSLRSGALNLTNRCTPKRLKTMTKRKDRASFVSSGSILSQ